MREKSLYFQDPFKASTRYLFLRWDWTKTIEILSQDGVNFLRNFSFLYFIQEKKQNYLAFFWKLRLIQNYCWQQKWNWSRVVFSVLFFRAFARSLSQNLFWTYLVLFLLHLPGLSRYITTTFPEQNTASSTNFTF